MPDICLTYAWCMQAIPDEAIMADCFDLSESNLACRLRPVLS